MKKTMTFAILSLMFALMSAMALDDAMLDMVETGEYRSFYNDTYWAHSDNFDSEEELIDYLADAAWIFLYGKAGWSRAALASNQEIISNSQGITAICGEWGDDDFGIYGVDMNSIMDRFKTEDFRMLDEATQLTKIREYIYRRFNPDAEDCEGLKRSSARLRYPGAGQ
ncbi:MAG: hypothetical protein PHC50_04740 [Candidatus Cloacimonetes bacterium]|nr:hypothetical protein [Candidatus Cloacimonadota bacterium]